MVHADKLYTCPLQYKIPVHS